MSLDATSLTAEGLAGLTGPKLITDVPGPEAMAWIERDQKVTSPSLPRAYPFVPRRGAGCIIEDVDGNIFLDMNAGIAVTSTGHCHPRVVEAVQRQATELLHYCASDFFLPIYAEVCERLDAMAPFGGRPARSFLTNSGTEAVEAAIKLSRFATGRPYLIGMYQSFHGRSMGSISLTASKARYRTNFGPLLPSVYHSFYGDFEYLDEVLFKRMVSPTEVAAIIVETWLGEGGYVLPPDGWFRYLRELCDRHGILLVCDEVQAGMGRSGAMWAIEHEGIEPDILLSGKGIASGLPLGAMIARDDLMVLGARVARLDVRRQPAVVRGGARDVRRDRRRRPAGERAADRRGAARRVPPAPGRAPALEGRPRERAVDRPGVRGSRHGGRGGDRGVPAGIVGAHLRRRLAPDLAGARDPGGSGA